MYRKKIAVTCLYNPINNSITSLQFTTNNHVKINATLPHDNFTSYNTIQDLIEQIVKRAQANNFDIPYYKAFNALWYNIDFIPLHGTDIVQYGYTREPKLIRRV